MASEKFVSVWDAVSDTPEEAANLRARAELMRSIGAAIKRQEWTQTEAAQHAGITQPRMSELLGGKVSKFSIDALVRIASMLGLRVHIEVEELEKA